MQKLSSFKDEPFIAILSYDEPNKNIICSVDEASKFGIKFKINSTSVYGVKYHLKKHPIDFSIYKERIDKVISHQKNGDNYLLNLCFPTEISTNLSLEEIYNYSGARVVIYKKDDFVCFSPEIFVNIKDGYMHTYPMKGTIEANLPDAKEILLRDEKEFSEQAMIVDLMRNDLSMVCDDVKVEKFRYIERVKDLYQTSSHISGRLRDKIGFNEIFNRILPAGSISGTPKDYAQKIISECEIIKRGYYTGVFIYFDGEILQSFVMIRFIKKMDNKLYFFSGGGITTMSDPKKEYDELIKKVYFPF